MQNINKLSSKFCSVKYFPKIDYLTSNFWSTVQENKISTINWEEFPYCPKVTFKTTHDGQTLFIHYEVTERYPVRAVNTKDQSPVHQDSCVEFFILDNDGVYHNFEFNTKGIAHCAKGEKRHERTNRTTEEMKKIIRYPSDIKKTTSGNHWTLTIGIPFDNVGLARGNSYRANFYKCGDMTEQKHYLSWNKISSPRPNFHCPEYFGTIEIE